MIPPSLEEFPVAVWKLYAAENTMGSQIGGIKRKTGTISSAEQREEV